MLLNKVHVIKVSSEETTFRMREHNIYALTSELLREFSTS